MHLQAVETHPWQAGRTKYFHQRLSEDAGDTNSQIARQSLGTGENF
jgi:hypothetical protein